MKLLNIRKCYDGKHKYIATFIIDNSVDVVDKRNSGAKSTDSKLKTIKFGAAGY